MRKFSGPPSEETDDVSAFGWTRIKVVLLAQTMGSDMIRRHGVQPVKRKRVASKDGLSPASSGQTSGRNGSSDSAWKLFGRQRIELKSNDDSVQSPSAFCLISYKYALHALFAPSEI